MAYQNQRPPGLPPGRPSHHWGKVLKPPGINRPVFGAPPPGGAPASLAPPGSLQDAINQLVAALSSSPLKSTLLYIPDTYPIPTATEFQVGGTVAITGPANTVTQIPGSSIQLPAGYIGVVHTFNISVLTTLTTVTNQLFSIRFNQVPAPGYSNRFFAGRAAQNLERSFDAALRIPKGALVDIVNTNVDGGSYTVGADIAGWYMSVADCVRWLQGQGQLTSST